MPPRRGKDAPRGTVANPAAREASSKIILGLSPSVRTATALDMIRCVLQRDVSELFSVYLEDLALLEHARSRLAREVSISGAARRLDATVAARQMRALSTLARRELDTVAATLGARHTFALAGIDALIDLAVRAAETDTLVITLGADPLGRQWDWRTALERLLAVRLRMLLFAREGWQMRGSVTAIVDEPSTAAVSIGVARQLCEQTRSTLTLLAAGQPGLESSGEPVEATGRGDTPVLRISADSIIDAARRSRAGAIVLPWRHVAHETSLVERLLAETRSALLLVGE